MRGGDGTSYLFRMDREGTLRTTLERSCMKRDCETGMAEATDTRGGGQRDGEQLTQVVRCRAIQDERRREESSVEEVQQASGWQI
jgi:hypothetical protein